MSWLYLPAPDPVAHESEWVRAVGGKWKKGRSAYELAHEWHSAHGLPDDVAGVLSSEERFRGLEPLLGLVEHQVPLAGRGPASHNDLLVVARRRAGGLVVMAVEAKVDESFGDASVKDWLAVESPNRAPRMTHLCEVLAVEDGSMLDPVRYQLVHRTASAVIEAKRFGAEDAIMLVHSFSPDHRWLDEYVRFGEQLGGSKLEPGALRRVRRCGDTDLWLGWATGTQA